jgi:hypothetical protein
VALGPHEKPAVVDHEPEPARALPRRPADPAFARLEMQRRGAEGQQRDPLSVQFGHIPQRLPNQRAAREAMFRLKAAIKLGPLGFRQ